MNEYGRRRKMTEAEAAIWGHKIEVEPLLRLSLPAGIAQR